MSLSLLGDWDSGWHIEDSELHIGEVLGQGSFAMVYKGEWRGVEVAVKVIKASKISAKEIAAFQDECVMLSKLHHPNIVQLYGASQRVAASVFGSANDLCIVTEFMSRGSLDVVLASGTDLCMSTRVRILLEAALGMHYLHAGQPSVVHRDLKTGNCLCDRALHVKIADFGLSRVASEDQTMTACGTPKYAAPEVLNHARYNTKADVWSFGVIIWEVLTQTPPYASLAAMQVAVRTASTGHFLPRPAQASQRLLRLWEQCLSYNPCERPDFKAIVEILQSETKDCATDVP